ncbi:tail length tape measure [Chlorella sorokiniana]|uniref:Tail length tape measure n=1 Tax=Chlorella sorokiniana TaxID=3076 RepID=A0A2P6U2P6_CHLSO|nr:tail length tape measure [Chlorella sorokiniana]|eukprot:PRW60583.1 tail length tape measure [Chlorella sorokiniana]
MKQLVHAPRLNKRLVSDQLEGLDAELRVAEAERRAAEVALEGERRASKAELETAKLKLQAVVAEYLYNQGLLDARGLIEFAEEQLLKDTSLEQRKSLKQLKRSVRWQQLLQQCRELEEAIEKANPSWRGRIPDKAEALYSQLSGRVHQGDMSTVSRVVLVEGPLSREDMRFLKCVADAVSCPCELRYKRLRNAVVEGDHAEQPVAGAEGQ